MEQQKTIQQQDEVDEMQHGPVPVDQLQASLGNDMMSKEKEHVAGFDLPEEIVRSILCWLPVRTLIRFSCVSKRWRFIIISDPQFAKSHLQLALQRKTLTHRVFITKFPPRLQSWEYVDSFNGSMTELTIPEAECVGHKIARSGLGRQGVSDEVMVIASCNGLVLLGHWSYCECLSIWNPSTGFFRRVPSPRITIENREIDEILEYTMPAFGYVSTADDYKILLGVPRKDTYFHVLIFSLRANCWRAIEAPHLSSEDTNCGVGALFNGAIHWFNHRFGLFEPATLYAFDLAEEEFRELPLPDCFSYRDYECTRVLSGRCLYVCCSNNDFDCSGEIWEMTQYAVAESWVKLFEIIPADLPDVFPPLRSYDCEWYSPLWDVCFVTEDGKLVIKLFDTNELVKFESRKEEELVELICIGRYLLPDLPKNNWCSCDLYAETLISVPV